MAQSVFVSGCFDLLHSGHIVFLQTAAKYGDLIVALGSDKTIDRLKNRRPINCQASRLFAVKALSFVQEAFVSSGSGVLDFEPEIRRIQPSLFVVNRDGDHPAKRDLCAALGIEYKVLERTPAPGLAPTSSTASRAALRIPVRVDLAGGWLDQPFVSRHAPGTVVVASVEAEVEFRSGFGLATSTRTTAAWLWGDELPDGPSEKLAQILFACENPPGSLYTSGSQDALGVVLPGISKLYYDGEHWPARIEPLCESAVLDWVESVVYLVPTRPRPPDFAVLSQTDIDAAKVRRLARTSELCWKAILATDTKLLGSALTQCFEAQVAMFPLMVNGEVKAAVDALQEGTAGCKLAGAGGGGYAIVVSESPPPGSLRVRLRRPAGN